MSDKKDYKATLNLPQTNFPMKADLPKREPEFLKNWFEGDIYNQILKKSQDREKFVLHDGPPYANGNIHIGHALNKTLKDIIIKYKTMKGFRSPYVPGWDCHGLPVEHQLFKELKINKYQISQVEFRKQAHDYALRYVCVQKEEFRRLGIFGEWDNPYLTLSHEYEEGIVSAFSDLVKKGYIYRGLKPVNWCYRCETALAEAEVEYEDHVSPSVFVKLLLKSSEGLKDNSSLVIWTTTPWTLIANVAVAVNPNFIYSYIKTDKGNLIIANVRIAVLPQFGIDNYEVIREFKGNDLAGLIYSHPFGLRQGKVVLADYVSGEEGTGLVHTAPGHGAEDYITGKRYNLDVVMPVDSKGIFDDSSGEFKGLNVYVANDKIVERLKQLGVLLLAEKFTHSYPHCWRCKNPIIFRATKQWFLQIDKFDLRKKMLEVIDKDVRWVPPIGKERISAMVALRPDWCLSRQRYWGVPIPAIICDDCKEEFLDNQIIDNFAKFVAQEGSDCWFIRQINDFLPEGFSCPKCQGKKFSKGNDILDVWFDSGVSSQSVLKKRKDLGFPCELYLEGSDQHRGWFQSSLIPAMCIDGKPPFKSVLTHGHVVDGQGCKMSKSQGNVISPQEIIKDYGADIVRLWVASSDYNEDIRISSEIVKRLAEAYRKIRNTARFILSNLYDFNPDTGKVAYQDLKKIDKWILFKLEKVIEAVDNAYANYEFYKAYKIIYDYCNEDLSMYYLDMIKGRLYTYKADSIERRAAQTAIYEVLNVLAKIMAPILAFTSEEIWQNMRKEEKEARVSSVHLADWPKINPAFAQHSVAIEENIDSELKIIMGLIADVAKALEEKRSLGTIGSSFDAKIKLLTKSPNHYILLNRLKAEIGEIFKVSFVEIAQQDNLDSGRISVAYGDIAVEVDKADGEKCVRCWNYSHSVGKNRGHELICDSCWKAIGGIS
jgi:isoleucyl-tRNA synthetase